MVHTSHVWIFDKKSNAWEKGSVVSGKGTFKKVMLKSGKFLTGRTFPVKHNGRRAPSTSIEKMPPKRTGPRPGRFCVPKLKVDTVYFRRPNEHGDYAWQLRQSAYNSSLHVYNENLRQQRDKSDNFPGGGNACARPYRPTGKSIGVPTGGSYGGFSSLNEQIDSGGAIVKDAIDESVKEIVDHVVENPGRFDTLYYCVNDPQRETDVRKDLIGMGIFNIGRDVRVYISEQLKEIPEKAKKRAIALRALERI